MREQQLKAIIAEAMYAGGLLAEQKYGGLINSSEMSPFVKSVTKLEEMLQRLSEQSGFEGLEVDKVLPLYKEIETVTQIH